MTVAVIGLAATGLATARVLSARGDSVVVCDAKPEAALDPARVAELRTIPNVTAHFGTSTLPDGIDLVVPSPGVPASAPPLVAALKRNIEIASEIEVAYRIARAPILAITGTNGKTTTTAMLGAICKQAGIETYVAGNIAEDDGKRLPLIEAAAIAPETAVIVAEISSFQLEWVRDFRPKVGAWLNLTTDHLDRYGDLESYAAAKAKLFAAQLPTDFAVFNLGDPIVYKSVCHQKLGKAVRIPFVAGDPLTDGVYAWNGEIWAAQVQGKPFPQLTEDCCLLRTDELQVLGQHNVANACAASAMALAFGIAPSVIADALRPFTGVAHRMEFVAEVGGVRFVNNSMCTNPAAVEASLGAVSGGVLAIAGGRHKGGDFAPMVESLAKTASHVVLIGEHGPLLGEALSQRGFTATELASDMDDAVRRAAAMAKNGETVLLVPGFASFDMFTGFEQRGQVFRAAVHRLKGEE